MLLIEYSNILIEVADKFLNCVVGFNKLITIAVHWPATRHNFYFIKQALKRDYYNPKCIYVKVSYMLLTYQFEMDIVNSMCQNLFN